jgi:hypothetical protein
MALENPYANSLDGLEIEDPVQSFFDYCKKREAVRVKRESGETFPWSDDPILQKGRFLNVFREDDKVSKSIIKFAEPAKDDLHLLIQALFFSRWCNRDSTIDLLTIGDLNNPESLKEKLIGLEQWENYTAYPVEDSHWDEKLHSRIDAATYKFYEKKEELAQIVLNSNRNVITATNNINKQFMMSNDFPIFMALIDIAWFREDVIPITTDVPTGIGAEPYLNRLQKFLKLNSHQDVGLRMIELQEEYWPEAKREFYPIDIEYQSCECRKYFSYVNGTKKFEGKNLFSV